MGRDCAATQSSRQPCGSVVLWGETAWRGSAGRRTLVGLRQAESGDGGGYEEGAAADNPCGTGVKHQSAV